VKRIKGTIEVPVYGGGPSQLRIVMGDDGLVVPIKVDLIIEDVEPVAPCSPCPQLPFDISGGNRKMGEYNPYDLSDPQHPANRTRHHD
jgi:hypothetical protein